MSTLLKLILPLIQTKILNVEQKHTLLWLSQTIIILNPLENNIAKFVNFCK